MNKLLYFIFLLPFLCVSQTQIGNDIDGEAALDRSGFSVSLSSDGSVIAIGAILNNNDNGSNSGHVRIYQNSSGAWTQIGADIDGEAAVDYSGTSVSLSSDGSVVAIGAYLNNGNGTDSGHVRIYQNSLGAWTQIGADIDGEAELDGSGKSVSLSANGSVVAIGASGNTGNIPGHSNSGHVRIYQNNLGTWTQVGADIDGEAEGDYSGSSVSLSSDGSVVAIGAYGNGIYSGHVRIFQNVLGTWTQIGNDIDGEATGDESGTSVSLSSDGSVVAIGAYANDGNGTDSGHVRIYQNISGTWIQVGADIDGEAAQDRSGTSVSLSSDGSVVAIGAYLNDGNGFASGHVRIFQNISGTWTQVGTDIDGETSGDGSGNSVSLSANGSIVAIGAETNGGNGIYSGHVRVYDLSAVLSSDAFVLSQFEVYPNPTSNQFTIQLQNGLQLKKINIYNQLGQFIKEETKPIIDVSKLVKGLYLVEILTNKGKAIKKVVVE